MRPAPASGRTRPSPSPSPDLPDREAVPCSRSSSPTSWPRRSLLCSCAGWAPAPSWCWRWCRRSPPGGRCAHTSEVVGGGTLTQVVPWVPGLDLELAFAMGSAAVADGAGGRPASGRWCWSTARGTSPRRRPGLAGFAGNFTAFAGSMLGLVLADDLLRAVRVLGADHGLLLPAHRLRAGQAGEPAGGDAGADRHHRRRAGDAGRACCCWASRQAASRSARSSPTRRAAPPVDGGGAAGAGRGAQQVGPGARSTSGCPARWPRPRRSAPTCTPPRW